MLYQEVFDRFGMQSSVPGTSFSGSASPGAMQFDSGTSARFADVVRRAALTYRLNSGRAVRSDVSPPSLSASTGVLSTVRDLARYDIALQSGALIESPTLTASWTQAQAQGKALPTGLGWFVQNYNGEPLIWQFGLIRDGHSALVLKLPRAQPDAHPARQQRRDDVGLQLEQRRRDRVTVRDALPPVLRSVDACWPSRAPSRRPCGVAR